MMTRCGKNINYLGGIKASRTLLAFLTISCAATASAFADKPRVWKSDDGKFSVEAKLTHFLVRSPIHYMAEFNYEN